MAKYTPEEAKEILNKHRAYNMDVHAVRPSDLAELEEFAKKSKYRKHKNAPASTGAMFHKHLSRIADSKKKLAKKMY